MIPNFILNYFSAKRETLIKGFTLSALLFMAAFSAIRAQTVYAITSTRNLVSFNAAAPSTILSSVPLTGALATQNIEGLDFRPATGELYAVTYNSVNGETQIYRIKIGTGAATAVGSPVTLATGMSSLGFDFNPMVDRIRLTSATRHNYRLNPNDGSLAATDGTLTYTAGDPNASATPNIRAAAYTNSVAGATTTTIYYYDFNLNVLTTSAAPNAGTITTVGNSTVMATGNSGTDLDIFTNPSTGANTAYLLAGISGSNSNFYTINLSTGAASLVGQVGNGVNVIEMAVGVTQPAVKKLVFGLSGNNLISFFSNTPATILSTIPLTGIGTGQTVVGLDFRPATGQLFAMGYTASSGAAQLYTINLSTGAATPVGNPAMLATNMTGIGFDFNPMVDRIRVTSSSRQNYRLNPNDGTITATDTPLTYAGGDPNASSMPMIHAVAYTNSFAGTTATTIYYYDVSLNILATSTAPNAGTISTVGSSGIMANTSTAEVDMDITSNQSTATNTAYLLASVNGTSSNFYMLNLLTGATSLVGTIGSGSIVSDMAVYIAPPAPAKNVYAIQNNNLINFSSATPGTILSSTAITGITAGQTIEGLDFRPANNQLYAMGYRASTGETQLYTINISTGAATPVGTAIMVATNMTGIGFDFNPTVDRIRVTSSTRKNYRLNPDNGALAATDTDLTYASTDTNRLATPDIHAVAYTNSFVGAARTTIYYYDFSLDVIDTSAAPNMGVLNTVGRTGITTGTATGLDMDIITDQANSVNTGFLSANTTGTTSNFYQVNLSTGEAILIGAIGGSAPITKFAVSNANISLPVTLLNFSAEKVGRTSKLSWVTHTELNNDHFIIERSVNGTVFNAVSNRIASKAVGGNSAGRLTYEFSDVVPSKGANYYRLLQVDRDGAKKYSNVVQVQFDEATAVRMYPSPTRGIVNVSVNITNNTTLGVNVTDASGRSVRKYQYQVGQGISNQQIDLSGLQNGMYYVIVTDNEKIIYKEGVQKQ